MRTYKFFCHLWTLHTNIPGHQQSSVRFLEVCSFKNSELFWLQLTAAQIGKRWPREKRRENWHGRCEETDLPVTRLSMTHVTGYNCPVNAVQLRNIFISLMWSTFLISPPNAFTPVPSPTPVSRTFFAPMIYQIFTVQSCAHFIVLMNSNDNMRDLSSIVNKKYDQIV